MKMVQSVPKRRHINFRRRGITQKKAYKKVFLLRVSVPKQYSEKCLHEKTKNKLISALVD